MIITNIKKSGKTKVEVYIDGELCFQLYPKEIKHYNIVCGEELSYTIYKSILEDTLLPRAKKRALNILKYMNRSEMEVRKKLEDSLYPQKVIHATMEFLLAHKYLDDRRFAASFISYRKEKKSWIYIKNKLKIKGINNNILEQLYQEEYLDKEQDPEYIAIEKEIMKKTSNQNEMSYESKQKLIASLYRKGFSLEKIRHFIR